MIYQSTVDVTELFDNLCNKKALYGDVSVICHKMLSVILYFHTQSLFIFVLEISFQACLCIAVC